MAEFKINPSSQIYMTIDLNDVEWSPLLPTSLGNFKVEESLRTCLSFPDGLFPGAESLGPSNQVSRIKKFPNYIEFSKVTSDEVVPLAGQLYLTTKFYNRRKEGWSSDKIEAKEGEVLSYCIDGDLYSPNDKTVIDKVYSTVYRSLVQDLPAYINLVSYVKTGLGLHIKGPSNFLPYLETLLNNIKS